MRSNMAYICVAVPVPLRQLFTYTHHCDLAAGVRVRVPFGPRKLVGIVVDEPNKDAPEIENADKIKAIETVLDEAPVIDAVLLKMAQWLWQYYHHAPGEVLHTMLPVLLRKGETAQVLPEERIRLTETGERTSSDELTRAPKQKAFFEALQKSNKDFDMLCMPNLPHAMTSYMMRREWDYLVKNLKGIEPPDQFRLVSGRDLLEGNLN